MHKFSGNQALYPKYSLSEYTLIELWGVIISPIESILVITIPGVYYKTPNKTVNDKIQKLKGITPQYCDNIWEDWSYADNLQDKIGIVINEFILTNIDLFYEQRGFSVYVDGLVVTLSGDQFEYL